MTRKLIWLGPAFTIDEALGSRGLAPAASRWQEGWLSALRDAGAQVDIVACYAEPLWPRGPMRVRGNVSEFMGMPRESVSYLNLPGCRESSVDRCLRQAIDRICTSAEVPDVLSSYNVWTPVARACRYASETYGIPWIPILLDHEPPNEGWSNVLAGVRGAAGVVFLSHWAFVNAPLSNKLHIDAGVAKVPESPVANARSRVILYSGALHRWAGIDTLLDAMPLVRTPGTRLIVVGRGGSRNVLRRLAETPSVHYLGAVDEPTLARLTEQAEVLANPRPSGIAGNEMNFPSKLLHYLTALKPVATTLSPGVAPEYEDVVIAARDDSPAAFASALDQSLALSDSQRHALGERIRKFLGANRLWSQQATRFLDWAHQLRTS